LVSTREPAVPVMSGVFLSGECLSMPVRTI
jgi:hypothetical protein